MTEMFLIPGTPENRAKWDASMKYARWKTLHELLEEPLDYELRERVELLLTDRSAFESYWREEQQRKAKFRAEEGKAK
jgi:hypothetical protein